MRYLNIKEYLPDSRYIYLARTLQRFIKAITFVHIMKITRMHKQCTTIVALALEVSHQDTNT